jgi:hypothetical protein
MGAPYVVTYSKAQYTNYLKQANMLQKSERQKIQTVDMDNQDWIRAEVDLLFEKYKKIVDGKLMNFPIDRAIDELQQIISDTLDSNNISTDNREKFNLKLDGEIKCERYKVSWWENRIKQTSSTAKIFFVVFATISVPVLFSSKNTVEEKWIGSLVPFISGVAVAKIDHDNYAELWKKKAKLLMIEGIKSDK